ncbi:MAG: glutathione S-transferase family protein [Henriciella sp.]
MRQAASAWPLTVYGSRISYYTGKLETYLRYRSIPYEMGHYLANRRRLKAGAGVVQMPVVELADGRWMSDTTPILAWLESQQDGPSIYPVDPVLNFLALLIEDYADEWLWRSAMHYRWSYRADRQYAAEALYTELVKGVLPLPRPLALNRLKRRQLGGFVKGDGVTRRTRFHADRTYLTALDCLQAILVRRPFLLGQAPTIADFGLMAPMFRHFSQDPTPSEIMRQRAPGVYAWVARMWNLNPAFSGGDLIAEVDAPLEALLLEVCETHLVQHGQNAEAFGEGRRHFKMTVQDCRYARLPVSRYRVWCLEQLRKAWAALDGAARARVKNHLSSPMARILWDDLRFVPSGYDEDGSAPFNRGINVYGSGVPPR